MIRFFQAIARWYAGGTTSHPYHISTTSMPFDMPYFVDEDYDVPMPGQNPLAFTSSTKLRINQRIDARQILGGWSANEK